MWIWTGCIKTPVSYELLLFWIVRFLCIESWQTVTVGYAESEIRQAKWRGFPTCRIFHCRISYSKLSASKNWWFISRVLQAITDTGRSCTFLCFSLQQHIYIGNSYVSPLHSLNILKNSKIWNETNQKMNNISLRFVPLRHWYSLFCNHS